MSRNPELEALLQAKFDLDTGADRDKAAHLRRYWEKLDLVLARSELPGMTRRQLEELLLEPYRDFRRAKLLEQRARLSHLR
ncbi:MAG: hypothetical protein FJ387_02600 [Verrucomicrobia bacterium]|nr:hypothetical protein [Verrucomicrobiota bacterium]